jgi:PadR family transcriptional regulator
LGVQRHRRQRTRNRRRLDDGSWEVRARVERFGEPGLLVLLADGPTHGYQLLERLPDVIRQERVDVGNVYRELRALEDEGIVASEWRGDLPGPAKRTYTLTAAGEAALASWLDALEALRDELNVFVERARRGGDHVRTTPQADVDAANA